MCFETMKHAAVTYRGSSYIGPWGLRADRDFVLSSVDLCSSRDPTSAITTATTTTFARRSERTEGKSTADAVNHPGWV